MLKKLLKNKKVISMVMAFSTVMAMATCFAADGTQAGAGVSGFLSALTTGLSGENIWSSIIPVGGLICIVTLVAVARRTVNKNLNAIKKGKSGQA